MKALLIILSASVLATLLGVAVLYLEGPVLLRIIVASIFIIPGILGSVASIDLILENL